MHRDTIQQIGNKGTVVITYDGTKEPKCISQQMLSMS